MMKAWELELDVLKKAQPVVLKEEEQGWDFASDTERMDDELIRMKWESMTPGSGAREHIIAAAVQAAENLGYDVHEAEQLLEEGFRARERDDVPAMAALYTRIRYLINTAPRDPSHPHWGYACYEDFSKLEKNAKFKKYQYDMDSASYLSRTHEGWIAQICAGAAGTAIEGYTMDSIRSAFGELHGYARTPNTYNDDITYEYTFLMALKNKGRAMTSADIAEMWVALVPMGWSAEEIALANLRLGVFPPESGVRSNPYCEWIGAQMRGAVCGMVAPGDPLRAARYAFMDGVVSHHNNGVLGEVFNAVLVALSYVKKDVRELVSESMACIPDDSEYHAVLAFALDACQRTGAWEPAWRLCEKRFEHYNWIHAYPNAAAELIALWFGEGDFEKTLHIIMMEGYDVDCNAAQICTAIAIMGSPAPEAWTAPIGDRLDTYMRSCKRLSILELSELTCRLGRENRE